MARPHPPLPPPPPLALTFVQQRPQLHLARGSLVGARLVRTLESIALSRPRVTAGVASIVLHRSAKLPDEQVPAGFYKHVGAELWRCGPLDGQGVANSLYGLHRRASTSEVRLLVAAVADSAQRCPDALSPRGIGQTVYGVSAQTDTPEVRTLFSVLVPMLRAVREVPERQLGTMLLGLKSQNVLSAEVKAMLVCAAGLLERCSETFTVRSLAQAYSGLRQLINTEIGMRVHSVLREKVLRSDGEMNAQQVSSILNSVSMLPTEAYRTEQELVRWVLSRFERRVDWAAAGALCASIAAHGKTAVAALVMSRLADVDAGSSIDSSSFAAVVTGLPGDGPASRQVLARLSQRLQTPGVHLDDGSLCTAINCIHKFECGREVRSVLMGMAQQVSKGSGPLSADQVAMMLHGVRSSPSNNPIRTLFVALQQRLQSSQLALPARKAAAAVFGLSRIEGYLSEGMLAALLPAMARDRRPYEPLDVAMCMSGLARQVETETSNALLRFIAAQVRRMPAEWEFTEKNVGMALYGLRGQAASAGVRDVLTALYPRIVAVVNRASLRTVALSMLGFAGVRPTPEALPVIKLYQSRLATATEPPGADVHSKLLRALLCMRLSGVDVDESIRKVQAWPYRGDGSLAGDAARRQVVSLVGGEQEPMAERVTGRPHARRERMVAEVFRRARIPGLEFHVHHESGFELDILYGEVCVELASTAFTYQSPQKRALREEQARILKERYGIAMHIVCTRMPLEQVIGTIVDIIHPEGELPRNWKRALLLASWGWGNVHKQLIREGRRL
eukprot:TRINITY_DN5535_c0_g1_i1.p1 TRINITY_DN5535_c0_g1~~TRINITY_DN5535_c0_g1_i1.p1  ORF type:complete len:818 (+),score=189.03 TRINITY_DN5535_c0_g1_i1:85-2454(+)